MNLFFFVRSEIGNMGDPRTIESLKKLLRDWEEAGAVHSDAKTFGNVIHEPLVGAKDNDLVIDILPPPELHLLLGVVNTLFSGGVS